MQKTLISKAKFAKQAGISASAVSRLCKNKLAPTMEGVRINTSHPVAIAYLMKSETLVPEDQELKLAAVACQKVGVWNAVAIKDGMCVPRAKSRELIARLKDMDMIPSDAPTRKRAVLTGGAAANENKKREAPVADNVDLPENIQEYGDWTLNQIVSRFGTDAAFLDQLKATKTIEDIAEKRLKNAAFEGSLVSRDLVKRGIIEPFESAHTRLLTDGAKSIARRCMAMAKADEEVREIEKYVADAVGSFIRPAKAQIIRAMENI
jgi:hypothetical protein